MVVFRRKENIQKVQQGIKTREFFICKIQRAYLFSKANSFSVYLAFQVPFLVSLAVRQTGFCSESDATQNLFHEVAQRMPSKNTVPNKELNSPLVSGKKILKGLRMAAILVM